MRETDSRRRRPSAPAISALLAALFAVLPAVAPASAAGALAQYVALPDPSYEWREVSSGRIGSVEYAELILTSQTWRGIPWRHQLVLFRPANIEQEGRQGLLFVYGGRWREEYADGWKGPPPREARLFARLAEAIRAPLGVVRQVPHQPLFERREDALIAYTFDRFLQTGEPDWPLLLPMVKSASRAMDAMQEYARERWRLPLERFTVSGASKRGWTSWLAAAVDPRVAGVAPMVIDMLNLPAQIELQRASFGALSEQVSDYADIRLPERLESVRGQRLLDLVDPYSYREHYTQPKLILLGTNDAYWPLDALNVYWDELPEPKHVLYVPNQGHGMRDYGRIIGALSALHRQAARGESLPQLAWSFTPEDGRISVRVSADREPMRLRLWSATSATRDFRDAVWRSHPCRRTDGQFLCRQPLAAAARTAVFAEATFREPGAPDYSLSTTICIVGGEGDDRGGRACHDRIAPQAARPAVSAVSRNILSTKPSISPAVARAPSADR